jgi:anti-sigma B factor antagonist
MSQPEAFTFERLQSPDGVHVIGLHGELDFAQAATFKATLLEELAGGARGLVLDLSALAFIDSSGISAIIYASAAAKRGGQTLIVASPGPQVARVFGMLNLSDVVPIEEDVETALRRIG